MSAANTVVENGGRVVLLDKSSFCGGNSTKATSGINGAGGEPAQKKGGGGHLFFLGGKGRGLYLVTKLHVHIMGSRTMYNVNIQFTAEINN